MSKYGFTFYSDAHLSELTWRKRPTLVGDSEFALAQVMRFSLQHLCPILDGGDTFDSIVPESKSVQTICRWFDELQGAGVPYRYVQGNHEGRTTPWLSVHRHPTHVHKTRFRVPGIDGDFFGLDAASRPDVDAAIASVPADVRFLLSHQVTVEMMGSRGFFPAAALPAIPYLLFGDYHEHVIRAVPRQDGRPSVIVSPGCTTMRKINEPDRTAFWAWNLETQQFDSIPLLSRPVLRVTITTHEQIDKTALAVQHAHNAAAGQMPDEIAMPIVIAKYDTAIAGAGLEERIREVLGPICHLFDDDVTGISEFESPDVQIVPDSSHNELRQVLQETLEKMGRADLVADVLFLLETKTPMVEAVDALTSMLEERYAIRESGVSELVPASAPGN